MMKTLTYNAFHSEPQLLFALPRLKEKENKFVPPFNSINQEWEHLYNPQINIHSSIFATAQSNRHKNRYPDILPFEKNRVILSKSRYINASNVTVQNKNFISSQAPLPHTFNDFWTMIWENKTPVIVMLTNFIEGKKIKAHCYWPSVQGHSEIFGDICVVLESVENEDNMVKRVFSVSKNDDSSESFKVLHIHYVDWPDFGVPDHPTGIVKIISEIDNFVESSNASTSAPVVVHCSAGIGRTGTLLAIIAYIEQKKASLPGSTIQIQDIVNSLRKQRIGMVQTLDQYKFIYYVVDFLNSMIC